MILAIIVLVLLSLYFICSVALLVMLVAFTDGDELIPAILVAMSWPVIAWRAATRSVDPWSFRGWL